MESVSPGASESKFTIFLSRAQPTDNPPTKFGPYVSQDSKSQEKRSYWPSSDQASLSFFKIPLIFTWFWTKFSIRQRNKANRDQISSVVWRSLLCNENKYAPTYRIPEIETPSSTGPGITLVPAEQNMGFLKTAKKTWEKIENIWKYQCLLSNNNIKSFLLRKGREAKVSSFSM